MIEFDFIEADQPVPMKPLFVVITGLPGIGKTSASFTVDGGYCIDADLGLARAEQKRRPFTSQIKDYNTFKQMVMSDAFAAEMQRRKVKTVIIDTVGALLDDVITYYLMRQSAKNSMSGGLSLQGWGALAAEFNSLINRFFSLDLNVVAVCHAKDDEDQQTKTKTMKLAVKGGSNDIILRKADMLGFIRLHNGHRLLDFNKSEFALIAKNTAAIDPLYVPHVTAPQYDNFMQTVLDATRARMESMSAAQLAAAKAQNDFQDKCDTITELPALIALEAEVADMQAATVKAACASYLAERYAKVVLDGFEGKTAAECNAMLPKLKDHPEQYKKVIWASMSEIARRNGVNYDSKSKKFIAPESSANTTQTTADAQA